MPDWLFSEKYLTLATWGLVLCTFLLVVATLILWIDSFKKGKEQRARWDQEDTRTKRRESPKYRFGLDKSSVEVTEIAGRILGARVGAELWFANFGLQPIYVDSVKIKHREMGVHTVEINRIVASGQELRHSIPDADWQKVPGILGSSGGNYLYGDHEVWLHLSDASSDFESDKILYDLFYMDHSFTSIRRGSHESRQITCPRCMEVLSLAFPATGLLTEAEVRRSGLDDALREVERSCPRHYSAALVDLA